MKEIYILILFCFINKLHAGFVKSSKFLPNGGISDDKIKYSVDVSGDYIVIGSPFEDISGKRDAGSITVYNYSSQQWDDGIKLVPDDVVVLNNFGYSVAIYDTQIIVGSPFDVDREYSVSPGSAYIYRYGKGNWTQEEKLKPRDGSSEDQFGYAVAINSRYAVVGNPSSINNAGSIYVFSYNGGTWTQEIKLMPSDGGWGDSFGGAVSIYDSYIAVGASWRDSNTGSGAAYIYKRHGIYWLQEAKLFPANPDNLGLFGCGIDIGDGRVVIGSIAENNYGGVSHLFKRVKGFWELEHIFNASDGKGGGMFLGDRFGASVSISGKVVAISAPLTDDERKNSGSVYLFRLINGTWTQTRKFLAWDGDKTDAFGFSIALDNNKLLVSSLEGEKGKSYSGSAYMFQIST